MSMNDLLSDMITRIRNGQRAKLSVITCPASNLLGNVLDVLKREGFIRDWRRKEVRPGVANLEIELKYYEGQPAIHEIKRISKPGRRDYAGVDAFKRTYNGLGITILTTSKGVMSDFEAKQAGVGGELLCSVF